MKFKFFTIVSTLALSLSAHATKPTLTIYTYDSFAADWGAAPKLKTEFEQQCDCEIKFIAFDDGITMLNRLRLEGKKSKADIMLGLDSFTIPEAQKTGLFAENQQNLTAINWQDHTFFPYDQGKFAFIYRKDKLTNPPRSLKELVERQDIKLIYQDPRTSVVGRGLLFWLNQVYGDNAPNAWQTLAKHTVTVGKGWSETYGAFLKGEADMVLSYTTSPLYHRWHEQNDNYVAAAFEEGHLRQVEVAAILDSSQQKALANQFLAFLHQPKSQYIIAYHNVMQPIIHLDNHREFKELDTFNSLPFHQPDSEQIRLWLTQWQQAVTK